MDLAAAARRITREIAKMQVREMYAAIQDMKPGEVRKIEWEKCG